MRDLIISTMLCFLLAGILPPVALGENFMPKVAKWYDNKDAAVSLRFDDTLKSHVQIVVPMLNKFGIPGTFMINPGKSLFKKNENFWRVEVPGMGHDLGNHTMNHRGAVDIKEAEFEIGEAARIIHSIFPERSPLMVFASGGGEKWGGQLWKTASAPFKKLVQNYHMIDLYDGKHSSFGVTWDKTVPELRSQVENAIRTGGHQPFSFHQIGPPGWKNRLRKLAGGHVYAFPVKKFESFINYLSSVSDKIWVATLLDILKYEEEAASTSLSVEGRTLGILRLRMTTGTDLRLFDHPLTIVLPRGLWRDPQALQNGHPVSNLKFARDKLLVEVQPFSSTVVIQE